MHSSLTPIPAGALVALATLGMSVMAQFHAPNPGALLEPVGTSASAVVLVQGEDSIQWTSQSVVVSYRIQGWPTTDGTHELGGAVTVVKANSRTGVVAFVDRPMHLQFDLRN